MEWYRLGSAFLFPLACLEKNVFKNSWILLYWEKSSPAEILFLVLVKKDNNYLLFI